MNDKNSPIHRFYTHVLASGPAAVLPQHLDDRWLAVVERSASDYLDATYSLAECRKPQPAADPILQACVAAILADQKVDAATLSAEALSEKLTVYALWVIVESASRSSDFTYRRPSLKDIFSAAAVKAVGAGRPGFTETLAQACVLRYPDRSFWERIVERFKQAIGPA